jgi:hypothetical protein
VTEHPEDYAGPATLLLHQRELTVRVRLVAVHQPVDGRIHWSGRIDAAPALHELLDGASSDVELVTASGRAQGKVGEPDPWGRYRVSGVGRPPFEMAPVPLDDD